MTIPPTTGFPCTEMPNLNLTSRQAFPLNMSLSQRVSKDQHYFRRAVLPRDAATHKFQLFLHHSVTSKLMFLVFKFLFHYFN